MDGLSEEERKKVLVHYQEINGGYATFLVGAKMDYLEDLITLVRKHNPVNSDQERLDEDKVDKEIDDAIDILGKDESRQ